MPGSWSTVFAMTPFAGECQKSTNVIFLHFGFSLWYDLCERLWHTHTNTHEQAHRYRRNITDLPNIVYCFVSMLSSNHNPRMILHEMLANVFIIVQTNLLNSVDNKILFCLTTILHGQVLCKIICIYIYIYIYIYLIILTLREWWYCRTSSRRIARYDQLFAILFRIGLALFQFTCRLSVFFSSALRRWERCPNGTPASVLRGAPRGSCRRDRRGSCRTSSSTGTLWIEQIKHEWTSALSNGI